MAAEDVLGDLIVNIGVDTKDLASGFDQAASQVGQGAQKIATELDGLDGSAQNAGRSLAGLGQSATDTWNAMGGGAESVDELRSRLTQLASDLNKAGTALSEFITVPLAGLGAAALAAGADFLQGADIIQQRTGAMGEQLKGLQQTFQDVFSSLPTTVGDAAGVISTLTDRMGIAGPALEAMSVQMLNLARITGTQAGPMVQQLTAIFNEWGISSDQASAKLDGLYAAVQKTGTSLTTITSNLRNFAPVLQEMGFSFDQAAAMIAKLDQSGVNVNRTMTGLRFALNAFGRAGLEDPAAGLQVITQMIKDAGTAGEANAIGLKVFGRGMSDTVAAIRSGKMDFADLVATMQGSVGTINSTADATLTLGQKFTELKNQVETALAPLGDSLLKILQGLFSALQPLLPILTDITQAFANLPAPVQLGIVAIAGMAAALGPLVIVAGAAVNGLTGLIPLVTKASAALGGFTGVIAAVAQVVGVVVAAFAGWKLGEWLEINVGEAKVLISQMTGIIDNQLTTSIHNATTSSKDFQEAMGRSISGLQGVGAAAHTSSQSTDEVKAALDRLINGADKAITAVKAIPFKDIASPQVLAGIKAVTDEHNKAFQAIVKATEQIDKERQALGDEGKGLTDLQVIYKSTFDALDLLINRTSDAANADAQYVNAVVAVDEATGELTGVSDAMQASLEGLITPTYTLVDAMEELGVQSVSDLNDNLNKAQQAFDLLQQGFNDGIVTTGELDQGLQALIKSEIDLAVATGGDAESLAGLHEALDEVNARLGSATSNTTQLTGAAKDLEKGFVSALSSLSKGLADAIVNGKNLGDVLVNLGKQMLATFIDIGLKAVTKFMLEGLAGLLGKAGFGGLSDLLGSIAGKMGGLFGGAGSAASGVAGDAAGAASGAGGGAASAIGGVASGITGIVGAIGSVGSMVTGAIGDIQNMHMSKLLGEIEVSTRGALNQLISLQLTFNQYLPILGQIKEVLFAERADTFGIGSRVADMHGYIKNYLAIIADGIGKLVASTATAVAAGTNAVSKTLSGGTGAALALAGGGTLATTGAGGTGNTYYVAVTDVDVQKLLDQLVLLLEAKGLKF